MKFAIFPLCLYKRKPTNKRPCTDIHESHNYRETRWRSVSHKPKRSRDKFSDSSGMFQHWNWTWTCFMQDMLIEDWLRGFFMWKWQAHLISYFTNLDGKQWKPCDPLRDFIRTTYDSGKNGNKIPWFWYFLWWHYLLLIHLQNTFKIVNSSYN